MQGHGYSFRQQQFSDNPETPPSGDVRYRLGFSDLALAAHAGQAVTSYVTNTPDLQPGVRNVLNDNAGRLNQVPTQGDERIVTLDAADMDSLAIALSSSGNVAIQEIGGRIVRQRAADEMIKDLPDSFPDRNNLGF